MKKDVFDVYHSEKLCQKNMAHKVIKDVVHALSFYGVYCLFIVTDIGQLSNREIKMTFSILIPTWNNLDFLKLCVHSIRQNSRFAHQIIVHVNEGADGTLEWVKQEGLDYTYSPKNIGVCLAMNAMRSKVKTDYICFLNDDMYVCPDWDVALAKEIESLGHKYFFLSASLIEPLMLLGRVEGTFGTNPGNFQEEILLDKYKSYMIDDWAGATTPPNIVHRDVWDLVGGYSVEYSPGMYSDPDFTAKLWLCGIRYFKGLGDSRVYHFGMKSTGRIVKNNGTAQFLLKWGMTNSTFRKLFSHKGLVWEDAEKISVPSKIPFRYRIRAKVKMLNYVLTSDIGSAWPFTSRSPYR